MNYQMSNPYTSFYNTPTTPLNAPNFNFSNQRVELIRVNGIDGAKAFQMNPNSTVALFDSNEDFMYIKSTDGAGFPSIRKFGFTEITDTPKEVNTDNWVSREEFEQFKSEVTDIGKQFIQYTRKESGNKATD